MDSSEENRFSPVSTVLLVLSAAGLAPAVVSLLAAWDGSRDVLPSTVFTGLVCLAFLAGFSVVFFLARTQTAFRIAAALKFLFLCLLIVNLPLPPAAEVLAVGPFLVELAAYETVGINLAEALAAGAVVTVLAPGTLAHAGLSEILTRRGTFLLAYSAVAAGAAALFFYRELAANAQDRNREIEGALKRLADANLGYLNYSSTVSEASKTEERNRITRELHDIVGYSFVTNIMMLEAARDLVATDLERGAQLIGETRDNLERGLTEIRQALYQWRVQEAEAPVDLNRILKMVQIIQKVTNLKVNLDVSDMAVHLDGEIGRFLFNFLQETIVNAFLHGKAHQITISFQRTAEALFCRVIDNGVGASTLKEGIGLQGIRERLGLLGGILSVANLTHGFEVAAEIPWRGEAVHA